MTVRRSAQQSFKLDKISLARYVRSVLATKTIYKDLREYGDGSSFLVNVKPSPLLLGTNMRIDLHEEDSNTIVTVTAQSQPWMIGDAFGFYDRYIADFLSGLRRAVGQEHISVVAGELAYKREVNWLSIVLIVVALVWLLQFLIDHIRYGFDLIFVMLLLFFAVILTAGLVRMLRGLRYK